MKWLRRKRTPGPPVCHRGRIFRDGAWWCYRCHDCDYGAGFIPDGHGSRFSHAWLVRNAVEHTNPEHWSRNRR